MGDHTEALQIDFDPTQISFAQIAEMFWQMHNPCATAYSRQYMSAFWYQDETQKQELEQARNKASSELSNEVQTPVLPLGEFYLAEDYHQKYRLQSNRRLMKELTSMYPKFQDFNNSTVAARLNGLLAGRGSDELFEKEFESYGIDSKLLPRR